MNLPDFEWNEDKDQSNIKKHGVSFFQAQFAFADKQCVIAQDMNHSFQEKRFYCFGLVEGQLMTVRFTYRNRKIRIFGAGYWRKGKEIYEKENKIHR